MLYLEYDEYIEYGGGLEPTAFDRYSVRATSRIRHATFGRIDRMEVIPIEVKHLCRDVIEYLHNNSSVEKQVISASQSQGGVSESETYSSKSLAEKDADIENLIEEYLASVVDDMNVPLLYRGCGSC